MGYETADIDSKSLVNSDTKESSSENYKYQTHLIEQYKIYVEMADRVSARRQSANSYFLAINTAIIGFVGYVSPNKTSKYLWVLGLGGVAICYLWYRIILSYKLLNSGKFKVIHLLEHELPAHPYCAEWAVLGEGKDSRLYRPVTHIENGVPWIFMFLHVVSMFQ